METNIADITADDIARAIAVFKKLQDGGRKGGKSRSKAKLAACYTNAKKKK